MLDENYIRNNLYLLDTAVESEYDIKSIYGNLSESFIREFKDNVTWWAVSLDSQLSEDFIKEFKDYVDWDCISESQELSEDFIREFKNRVGWYELSRRKLSESFIMEFKDNVVWPDILVYQKLSEDFIRELDKLDLDFLENDLSCDYFNVYMRNQQDMSILAYCWLLISGNQKLSEDFIREFADKVNWEVISLRQELSEDFIREFADKVDWCRLLDNKKLKLSEDFLKECRINGYLPLVFFNTELSFYILQTKNLKCFEIYVCQNNNRQFYNKKTFDDENQLVRFLKGMFNDFSVSFSFKVNPIISVQYFDSPESEIVAYDLENINYDLLTRQF